VPELLALAAALWLGAGGLALAGAGAAPGLGVAALFATFVAAGWSTYVTVAGVRAIRRRTAEWRADPGDALARARAKRPHAAGARAEVAHDEYAVVARDDGRLVTWRLRPLAVHELPGEDERVLGGIPRYAAAPVAEAPPEAGEAAQATAARWEREALEEARGPAGAA